MTHINCCCGINRFNRFPDDNEDWNNENFWINQLSSVISYCEIEPVLSRIISTALNHLPCCVKVNWTVELSRDKLSCDGFWKARLPHKVTIWTGKDLSSGYRQKLFPNPLLGHQHKYGVYVPIAKPPNLDSFKGFVVFGLDHVSDQSIRSFLTKLSQQLSLTFNRLNKMRANGLISINNGPINTRSNTQAPGTPRDSSSSGANGVDTEKLDQSILALCGHLNYREPEPIQIKLIDFMNQWTGYSSGFILLISSDQHEYQCQVVNSAVVSPEVRFHMNSSIFSSVINCSSNATAIFSESQLKSEMTEDARHIERLTQETWTDLLLLSIKKSSSYGFILGLANSNKTPDNSNIKTLEQVQFIFNRVQNYVWSIMYSSLSYDKERKLKLQTESMLQIAMNIFRKMDNLPILLKEIMSEAKKLTSAERCSVFLLDEDTNELVAKVFDGLPIVATPCNSIQTSPAAKCNEHDHSKEIRIPLSQGIAGHVASTGQLLNICDAYSHPLFYRGVDQETGYKTRNILCFPIKNDCEKVMGVAQLCNKINGAHFNQHDEQLAVSFAVYCGISIVHSLMYKNVQDAQHRNRLANELMTYHMQISEDNFYWLSTTEVPSSDKICLDFNKFSCLPRTINEKDSLLAVLSMFYELEMPQKWRIPRSIIARFTLKVRRGYRDDPAYHNWSHAFSVAHFMFVCLTELSSTHQLQDLESLALFVAALCHDIDHRGTNNSFQVNSNSVLAALYSNEGSVLERHHFSQTVCILNSEGCNIFTNVTRHEYQQLLDLLRQIILATDLSHHFRVADHIKSQLINRPRPTTPGDTIALTAQQRKLLMYLLMTCADLSDQSKPWDNASKSAKLLYDEFFAQGDLEKKQGQIPAEQMDRDKANIPLLQIQFLDGVVKPCFTMFMEIYTEPGLEILSNIEDNRLKWTKIYSEMKDNIEGTDSKLYQSIFSNSSP